MDGSIRLRDVVMDFGKRQVLKGLTFSARAGEVTTLVAPNGGGKTTTFRIIAGLLVPQAGTVEVDGVRQTPGTGRVPVSFSSAERTVWRNQRPRAILTLYAMLAGYGKREARERVQGVSERLGMGGYIDRPQSNLSTGEAMKLTFARILLTRNRTVILDEPTLGLDRMSALAMEREIRSLKSDGRIVLMSTHRIDEVANLSDRILVMSEGVIVDDIDALHLRATKGEFGAMELLNARAAGGWR